MKVKKRYAFKCTQPGCDCETVECVQNHATVTSKILDITEDEINYGKAMVHDDDGEPRFQCSKCGNVIANSNEDLILKLEQEYFSIKPSFIAELVELVGNLGIGTEDEPTLDSVKKEFTLFLKEKGIEVEE